MNAGAQARGTKGGAGEVGGGRGDEHQHLKDERKEEEEERWTLGKGGGSRWWPSRPEEETDEKQKKFQRLHERRLFHPWRRLVEAVRSRGRDGGRSCCLRRPSPPRWNEKNQNPKQTDDVYALSLGKGRPQHKHSRYHKHLPVSLLGSWQLHGARGASGTTATTLAANPRRKRWRGTSGKTNRRRRAQTKLLPSQHSTVLRDKGRGGEEGRDHFITPLMKFYKKTKYIYI